MENIYQVVYVGNTEYLTYEELQEKYEITGFNENSWNREELQGEPKLAGILGPMYNGMKDGKVVIRYESQKAYNLLSV
ncbi:hypothetical protein [Viridibacillus arvi]|uniref:hypothetical protein n=1 Tax=Viridibacillus arvi TaxID=263475 RepID=UPI0034CD733C